jgi:replicative DNA helicase
MILYTKQDDRAALPAPVEGNPQLYKNIKLDGSNLICIAGRPGMGKTSFALHLAQEYAKNNSKAVYIFTLELLSNHVYDRLLISSSEVDSYTYREKLFSATEAERV